MEHHPWRGGGTSSASSPEETTCPPQTIFTQCCYTTTINITTETLFNWCSLTVEQEIPLPFAVSSQNIDGCWRSRGLGGVEDVGLSGPTPDPAPCQRHSLKKKKKTLENTLDLL